MAGNGFWGGRAGVIWWNGFWGVAARLAGCGVCNRGGAASGFDGLLGFSRRSQKFSLISERSEVEHWELMSEKSDAEFWELMSEWFDIEDGILILERFENEKWEGVSERSDAENWELISKRSGGKSWSSKGVGMLIISVWGLGACFAVGLVKRG